MRALFAAAVLFSSALAQAEVTDPQIGQWARESVQGGVDCPMSLGEAASMHQDYRSSGARAQVVNAIGCACNAWALNETTLRRYSDSECGLTSAVRAFDASNPEDEKLRAWGERLATKTSASVDQLTRKEALRTPAERLASEEKSDSFRRVQLTLDALKASVKSKRAAAVPEELNALKAAVGAHERGLGVPSRRARALLSEGEAMAEKLAKAGRSASAVQGRRL